jgi:hypothetical protein
MSWQATEARFLANQAAEGWKAHRPDCSRMARAIRERKWFALCEHGAALRRESQDADRELANQRRLDKLPSPDQALLF